MLIRPDFCSRREIARTLGMGLSTVASAIRRGAIPSTKVGKRRLVPRAWVDELVREALERR